MMGIQKTKIDVSPEEVRKIASRRARGVPLRDLEAEFGFSRPVINRVLTSDEARQIMLTIMKDDVALENAQTRKAAAELGPLAIAVLKKKLEEGDLRAVEPALKASGIYIVDPKDSGGGKQQQALQIIFPGEAPAPPKEVVIGNIDV